MKTDPIFFSALLLSLISIPAAAEPVTLSWKQPDGGRLVASSFIGLSMETETVNRHSQANGGKLYFSPDNKALIASFRQLGVKHLRLGGNTVDDKTKAPSFEDIDALFAFARTAGLKVSYAVRLKDGDPAESARIARHIYQNHGDLCTGLTIGNEPSHYLKQLPEYLTQALPHARAIKDAVPAAKLNGPGIYRVERPWVEAYHTKFGAILPIDYLSGHAYPFGTSYDHVLREIPNADRTRSDDITVQIQDDSGGREGVFNGVVERNPAELRRLMLNYRFPQPVDLPSGQKPGKPYDFVESGFAYALEKGIPFRMDEINSSFMGGARDAGNSMAAAIWALTYMYSLADAGAQGINFHTGTTLPFRKGVLPLNATRKPCYYAALWQLPDDRGFTVQAVGYAMKTFALAAPGGRLFPVELRSAAGVNLLAYGVKGVGAYVFITILNREIDMPDRTVKMIFPVPHCKADTMALVARKHSAAATCGFTLGGAAVDEQGNWDGKWTPLPSSPEASVTIPACSALVVRVQSAPSATRD